jgi:hypothetical protein
MADAGQAVADETAPTIVPHTSRGNMSQKPAAIKGTFSDFKLIKTRKLAQLIIEIPIELADSALAALRC